MHILFRYCKKKKKDSYYVSLSNHEGTPIDSLLRNLVDVIRLTKRKCQGELCM